LLFGRLPRQALRMLCVRMAAKGLEKGAALRQSGLGPIAHCRDLTSDGIQAHQLKRTFIRRTFSSIHFNEDLAAIRH
jgi:hypothetical protein